jgi:hypothetical protein
MVKYKKILRKSDGKIKLNWIPKKNNERVWARFTLPGDWLLLIWQLSFEFLNGMAFLE